MKKFELITPVLLLVFNRIDTTKKVFEEIRKVKPKELFITADGPRNDKEKEKTDAVRNYILKSINWECKIKTLFRNKNLGCKYAVSSAIDWFFDNVEQGIILEDDCLPSQSFFQFCQEILEKYKDDERIMQISGTNIELKSDVKADYFFSRSCSVWGWATWRRAWKKYDIKMTLWPRFKLEKKIKVFGYDLISKLKSIRFFDNTYKNKIDTWDFQWDFACKINNGLSIVPRRNLIKNIGFGGGATHTNNYGNCKSLDNFNIDFPLTHEKIFLPDINYEKKYSVFFRPNFIRTIFVKMFMKKR